ncbi:acyl transferase 1-like [Oryza brachyantha]|uniref:acyl transferase 1-like n=1 Tax=Oryza brachyantha TaxID=4533 RepID=UPI001ADC09A9|nr:acyl transferase 1-like [Oryza brachyantha]
MVTFTARRSEPALLLPARPTPRETKALSDLDDQRTLRYYETVVGFFRRRGGDVRAPADPAKAIRAVLAEALVYYYPVAGRLREERDEAAAGGGTGRLVVDCTAEGVVFVEADADVRLEEFGQPLLPPYPCVGELLCDAGDTRAVVGKPLLLMQVTRLKCGGFVLGFHICHNIADGFGMAQLIMAIADLARGAPAPTILPVWRRDLLTARCLDVPVTRTPSSSSSVVTSPAHEPALHGGGAAARPRPAADAMRSTPPDRMVVEYFLFGPREVSTLRGQLPAHLAESTTAFELLTAVMWQCRTAALGYGPDQLVRLMITMNARGRWNAHTPLPLGYYGNAHVSPVAEAAAGDLLARPLADTVELVRRTKRGMTREGMSAMVETVARLREWPPSTMDRVYEVSDIKWTAVNVLRFGWAELAGGGIPLAGDLTSKLGSDHMRCKNAAGEVSTVVSMLLPRVAMARFKKEMAVWLNKDDDKSLTIMSSL